ncbi:transglutaminase-like putative cysteine protease [Anoxybacillus tepidamans]|uniref:Transglutaminase-like putative cysteine protease n=1 Tax=Anoxybacteroides tepidamans TaxID=265948 RepID=A0A7W8IV94_9BACL|nr:transglutaminaseTgpA domain-containing protein [Anoxybacillus tepidamans]MBB5326334.1 transglutaminase-like putative cysteine protease [Anoxybacillus tepidamans]
MNNTKKERIYSFVLSIVAFWLLWEWLVPLKTVSDTKNVDVFIGFVAFCLLLSFWRLPRWLAASFKLFYIFYALNALFFHVPFLSFRWLPLLVQDVVAHMTIIRHFRWLEMTNVFRSLLFFLLLWMMVYLVRYWLLIRRRIWLFYAMTLTYIAVLDTFTAFYGNGAIVRLVGVGFFLISWLHYERLQETKTYPKWLLLCMGGIGISLLMGYIGPKPAPQWPDPVAFMKSYAKEPQQETDNPAVKKIGYGSNDSRLGGPFIADDTVVFTAIDEQRHYWRVETKDVYTGKGWEVRDTVQIETFDNGNVTHSWWDNRVKKTISTAHVQMAQARTYLVYPEGIKTISAPQNVIFRMQSANEKIYSTDRESYIQPLQEYVLTYEYPTFSVEQLKAAPAVEDRSLLQQYTQLPDTLPPRVRELAEAITKEKTTQYEKTKAIEQYFRFSGFVYETKEVAVPGKNDDYVDQFLFETKKGYCDNFSTSMVVMLRSIGIPSRWVKGYTSGQLTDETKDGKKIYTITNNNAHSWVEVYFSGIGWVPFEPTQGFSNPYEFTTETISEVTPIPAQKQTQPVQQRIKLNDVLQQERALSSNQKGKFTASILTWKKIVVFIVFCVITVCLLYQTRRKWWPYITLFWFKYRHGNSVFIKAYVSLLRHLRDYGLKRKQGQTLRQYAACVDEAFGTDEMSRLTLLYERAIYKNDTVDNQWEEMKELWENLIKKTVS